MLKTTALERFLYFDSERVTGSKFVFKVLDRTKAFEIAINHDGYSGTKSFAFFHAMGGENYAFSIVTKFAEGVPEVAFGSWIHSWKTKSIFN